MCGIIAATSHIGEEKMEEILNSMIHRGPDEGDQLQLGSFHFGHRRLSIIGVDEGKQPISNEEQTKCIVCNGEIYNYKLLKKDLEEDVNFLTKSDSEVPLKLYEKEGVEGVKKLEGMFAYVIADRDNNTFFAARDTLGIKPLYYSKDSDGEMIFASELKSIYLFTDQAKEFPPGHYYTPETGFVSYCQLEESAPDLYYKSSQTAEIRRHIHSCLEKAVEKRLMSDVELGVLLSGGLDSSLVAAIAQRLHKGDKPLNSFCVGVEGSQDIIAAREVAQAIGTRHHEYIYTKEELIEVIPQVIYHLESFDPSVVRSAIPTYFVSKLASKHVKVVLSGEGADELFSGYAYLQDIGDPKKLNNELLRIINTLHYINLQRFDRMSMAHSLEGRVPFLDIDLVRLALKIPGSMKLSNKDRMEKTLLREAFEGELPPHILWRKKAEFADGSGASSILETYTNNCVSDQEFLQAKESLSFDIRNKQEYVFYKIFRDFYPQKSALSTVGHWAVS